MDDAHATRGARERGVSPVVGVLLMVAVTVVLASVAGVGVLDAMAGAGTESVQVSLSVSADAEADRIHVDHEGGDPLDASETSIVVTNATASQTFTSPAGSARLTRGETATIDLARTAGNNRVDWNGSTDSWEYNQTGAFTGVAPDDELRLLVIHRPKNELLFQGHVPIA